MRRQPIIVVNFKSYASATGEQALRLARVVERAARALKADIRICVGACDLRRIAREVRIPVYAQHIDADEPGAHTGAITAEAIKAAGAAGTLLNHSERRLGLDVLERSIERAHANKLTTIACASTPDIGAAIDALNPHFIAIEPPELIGGEVSVSSAKPDVISRAVRKIINDVNCESVLVGAGVKEHADLIKALELGAHGVLLASHITNADDPGAALHRLLGR